MGPDLSQVPRQLYRTGCGCFRQGKLRAEEVLCYFRDLTKQLPSEPVRIVIFGQGRSGSRLLENLLCSTGYFEENLELLNTDRSGEIVFPIPYVRGLAKQNGHSNFIFHVKVYQLDRDRNRPVDPAVFLKTLHNEGWKVIYLRRKNKVRQHLSNLVAQHRGEYHKTDHDKETFRLDIDCESFVEKVKERFRFQEAEEEALKEVDYCEIIYEDDLEDASSHQPTVDRILDFVSLPRRTVETNFVKINTQPLDELICNYDDFLEHIRSQGWEDFIDE